MRPWLSGWQHALGAPSPPHVRLVARSVLPPAKHRRVCKCSDGAWQFARSLGAQADARSVQVTL